MTNETGGHPPIRRVVTGHGANRTAKVLIDATASNKRISKSGGVSTLIWSTDRMPADISVGEKLEDMGARVQRGTNHAWINRGPNPARVAFILIDAKPLGIGHPVTDGATVR